MISSTTQALRTAGRKRGFVLVEDLGRDTEKAHGAFNTCREAMDEQTRLGLDWRGTGRGVVFYAEDLTEEEAEIQAAAEERSERLYASSYGLGL
jgi:hypothetical protein